MLLITQSLNLLEPSGAAAVASVSADGGGFAIDIIHLPPKKREKHEYKPKPKKLGLQEQYDELLARGLLEIDEYLGIIMIHGIDPLKKRE